MLTPDYLASCSDYLLGMYDQLETQIVTDIARRIAKNGVPTQTAIWQYQQVQEIGALQDEIHEEIAAMTGKTSGEIARLFEEAGAKNVETNVGPLISHGIEAEVNMSDAMRQVLEAEIRRTQGDIYNLTKTMAGTSASLYQQYSNQAYLQVTSGAFSPQQAIRMAVKGAAKEGAYVQFPKRRDHLDVAVRRNLITSINQTAAALTDMQAEDMGVEYYEVSAHAGARPSHAEWHGRIYKIEGSSWEYPNFYESTGMGEADGLCGVNCRHTYYPFWPGISKPNWPASKLRAFDEHTVSYDGGDYTDYEASQIQRGMERGIRSDRRELASLDAAIQACDDEEIVKGLTEEFKTMSTQLKERERRLQDFCHQTGRALESNRVQVHAYKDQAGRIVRWDRSLAQKAIWATKR